MFFYIVFEVRGVVTKMLTPLDFNFLRKTAAIFYTIV